jgi:outer membrane protein insertion porin family/translocation and assembly module TamA
VLEQLKSGGATHRTNASLFTPPTESTKETSTPMPLSDGKLLLFLRLCVLALLLAAPSACSKIPPGRSAVDSVAIRNAKGLSAGDVEDKISTVESTKFLMLFRGIAYDYSVYDEATLQHDMARVERFYRSKGFLDAQARVAHVVQVSPRHVRIEIIVDEGPATHNRNITMVGLEGLPADVALAARRAASDALPRGARFDEDQFKTAKKAVTRALTDRGYAYANVDADSEVDIGTHVADYGFRATPGPRAVFGAITFEGLQESWKGGGKLREGIPAGPLLRAIDIKPGQTYSTADIDSATQALLDLGVFASVQILPTLPEVPPADHVVPLVVKAELNKLHQLQIGGGIELDEIKTDVHATASWEDHNFLGGLRDFSAAFKPGVVLYPYRINNWTGTFRPLLEEWLKTELRQPGFVEARTTAFVRPQFNIFPLLVELNPAPDTPVVGYREVKVPIGVDRTFWKKLYVALDYNLQVENPFAYVDQLDPALSTIFLSYPELVTRLDFRDNAVQPHEGIYLSNTLQIAGGIFGGSAADIRIQPEVRTYVPIARGVTFATRASVGFLWSSNYGKNWNSELENSAATTAAGQSTMMTPAERDARSSLERDVQIMYFRGFFSGGPTTNRGFPLLGVGPHAVVPFLNPATASQQVYFSCDPGTPNFDASRCYLPVGGFTLWELQNEVRVDVSGPLSIAAFCDMGDVSPNELDIRLDHIHMSVGLGAAYQTPAGPIRVDIGYRIEPLQVLGVKDEHTISDPTLGDPTNGVQPTVLGVPIAVAIGIGEAF